MLRLQSFLLITVNALDRRLMRRASAASCGRVPSTRNRRKGLAQAGSSSAAGSSTSIAWLFVPSAALVAATCAGSFVSSSSATTLGSAGFVFIDLWFMLSRTMYGGFVPRVDPTQVRRLLYYFLWGCS